MNSDLQCALKGSYKVDLYSGVGANRKLVDTSEWFDNDITCTGLNYPYVYSFAECFRFLSLGISPTWGGDSNTGNAVRTGLRNPITGIRVYDSINGTGFQPLQYIGWQGYEIGGPHDNTFGASPASACGSKFTDNGISLYRGWTIPTGAIENGTVCDSGVSLSSFMVSPSSGNSTGQYAFSIADRQVDIPSGFTATISYQLSLNFLNFKSRTYFSGKNDGNGWFNTGTASTGTNGSELSLLSGWSNFSGIYRQVLPGLQMVDTLGACIIPTWGDQMEPKYAHCRQLYFYMTPDNSQFAVNALGVPALNTESGAYNSDGLMANYMKFATGGAFIHGANEDVFPSDPNTWYYSGSNSPNSSQNASSSVTTASIPSNIRMESLLSIKNYNNSLDPDAYNYQTQGFVSPIQSQWPVSFATPGALGFDYNNYPNYGQRAIFSTYLRTLPNSGLKSPTGTSGTSGAPIRSKSVSRMANFSPIHSMGYNSRYGSMVLGYLTTNGVGIGAMEFKPYIDFLFFDTSGAASNMPHYRLIPEICLTERGSGVSAVTFSITGKGGVRPSSVNRFFSVQGFMGPGADSNNPNTPSGLDINHPMFNGQVTNTSYFSGYGFTGSLLNTATLGDYNYNNQTGWGSVYGVVGNSKFYSYPMDCCLIRHNAWTGNTGFGGFVGDLGQGVIPNITGDYTQIYWPSTGSGLGLNVSNVRYFLSGFGDFGETDYGVNSIANFNRILLGNIYHPTSYFPNSHSLVDTGNNFATNPLPYLTTFDGASYNNVTDPLTISGNYFLISYGDGFSFFPVTPLLGRDGDSYTFSGFSKTNFNPSTRGLASVNFSTSFITGGKISSTGIFAIVSGVGMDGTYVYNPAGGDYETPVNNLTSGNAGANTWSLSNNGEEIYRCSGSNPTTATWYDINSFIPQPAIKVIFNNPVSLYVQDSQGNNIPFSQFKFDYTTLKRPTGKIVHRESYNGSGYRILPNYAFPNNQGIDSYSPVRGGILPAMSMENGLQMFCTFTWSGG